LGIDVRVFARIASAIALPLRAVKVPWPLDVGGVATG
jgi:hypothetical protein